MATYRRQRLSNSKTAKTISFLGRLYDRWTGKTDPPLCLGQSLGGEAGGTLKGGTNSTSKQAQGFTAFKSTSGTQHWQRHWLTDFLPSVQVFVDSLFILGERPGHCGHWTNLFSGVLSLPFPRAAGQGQTCPTDTSHAPHPTWPSLGQAGERRCRADQGSLRPSRGRDSLKGDPTLPVSPTSQA